MRADEIPAEIVEAARAVMLQTAPQPNAELRPDGTPDPEMSAYVEGWHDAWQALPEAAAAAYPLIARRVLEGLRAEVATWHVYGTRDIGDAYPADEVWSLIETTKETR